MTASLREGGSFGDYRVVRRLGKGGMGEVWLLENASGGQLAAKILTGEANHESRRRFLREAELALGVKHPNLVEVFDVGEDPETGLCYILMEYVPGGTLADVIKDVGPLPIEDAVAVVQAMADVLELGRQKGVVHRDVKPANIMFGADGTPKLADLGIARGGIGGTDTTTVTQTGMMIGTPAYMAPEQMLDAHHVDTRADIYSLGIVFFEMLTGERPNKDDTVVQLMAKAMRGEPLPDIRKMRPDVPASLAKLLEAMVEPDKADRIPTPGRILQLLADIERGGAFRRLVKGEWTRALARFFLMRRLRAQDVFLPLCILAVLAVVLAVILSQEKVKVRGEGEEKVRGEEKVKVRGEGEEKVKAKGEERNCQPLNPSISPPPPTLQPSNSPALKPSSPPTLAPLEPPKPPEPLKPQVTQDPLDAMFSGWGAVGNVRAVGRMESYGGVTNVLCARAADAHVPMTFARDVVVAGQHPVLLLRLSNQTGNRDCRLRVKLDGKVVREKSVADGWARIYVRLDSWRGKKVKVELDQWSSKAIYWSSIRIADSQLLAERAREQEVAPLIRKKPTDASVRRKRTNVPVKTCADLFRGWKVGMGESDYEETFRGRRENLVTQSSYNGGTVILSRSMKMPSPRQFPKPEMRLYVTVATRSGGEFGLQVMANGTAVWSQDILGDSWKPLRCDLSAWAGKDVLLELICVPKGQKKVCAYWNRIEVK